MFKNKDRAEYASSNSLEELLISEQGLTFASGSLSPGKSRKWLGESEVRFKLLFIVSKTFNVFGSFHFRR